MAAAPRTAPPMLPSGGLGKLLEAEARLDDQVAESLCEAEAVVAAAHAAVAQRLAEALARTSRQVNTLERGVGPELAASVRRIRGDLEEREREDAVRLRRLVGS